MMINNQMNTNGVNNKKTLGRKRKHVTSLFCVVCGAKSYGFNFNAITCESCKAFFRRNALQSSKHTECRGVDKSNNCQINVETRKRCKKCRLQKCFKEGMNSTLILSEVQLKDKKEKIRYKKLLTTNESFLDDEERRRISNNIRLNCGNSDGSSEKSEEISPIANNPEHLGKYERTAALKSLKKLVQNTSRPDHSNNSIVNNNKNKDEYSIHKQMISTPNNHSPNSPSITSICSSKSSPVSMWKNEQRYEQEMETKLIENELKTSIQSLNCSDPFLNEITMSSTESGCWITGSHFDNDNQSISYRIFQSFLLKCPPGSFRYPLMPTKPMEEEHGEFCSILQNIIHSYIASLSEELDGSLVKLVRPLSTNISSTVEISSQSINSHSPLTNTNTLNSVNNTINNNNKNTYLVNKTTFSHILAPISSNMTMMTRSLIYFQDYTNEFFELMTCKNAINLFCVRAVISYNNDVHEQMENHMFQQQSRQSNEYYKDMLSQVEQGKRLSHIPSYPDYHRVLFLSKREQEKFYEYQKELKTFTNSMSDNSNKNIVALFVHHVTTKFIKFMRLICQEDELILLLLYVICIFHESGSEIQPQSDSFVQLQQMLRVLDYYLEVKNYILDDSFVISSEIRYVDLTPATLLVQMALRNIDIISNIIRSYINSSDEFDVRALQPLLTEVIHLPNKKMINDNLYSTLLTIERMSN
ncbi:hypothetical protein SNEBB_002563 [Seison nebaliae]|nr:hypothetical protein SNEBB_002563 [Seison nebaliae]